ncbi:MAG: hypothetical protein IH793_10985, partial [Acidobacteria bacterium]|nr:hypothetical protein [Acidobacteriota bacterium]
RAQLIERVLYLSGLAQQIEQMPVQATAQLDERDEEDTEGVSPEARERLRQIVAEAFGREVMYQSAVGTFTKWFDQDRFQRILEWLESPLTQKITQVEVEAPDQEMMEEFMFELRQQRPDPVRVELVKRLDAATGATDLSLEVMHAVMTGMRDISDMPGSAPLADAATAGRTKELDKALYKTQYRSALQANAVIQFLFVYRNIPRVNEQSFWPHCSSRIEGRLNQAATLRGLENISPARNIQFIPYGAFRSFRTLDTRDPNRPFFVRDRADPDAGLDAKFVFKDSLVLDVTVNPDFNQVESDQPQITANQRFEVFFPEKRPFFLENANFFQTPINLLFTRRIADPQFGVRLTGKTGPYAIGALLMDDESPGKSVPAGDPLHGKRALFAIARVSRDIFQQSNLGAIYTSREFQGSYNRVGGADSRLRLNNHWVALFQGVRSWTRELDGSRLNGTAFDAEVRRSGRQFSYSLEYNDRSPDFRTASGFLRRPDIRRIGQNLGYFFRPEGKRLISWGPGLFLNRVYDHEGTRLDWGLSPSFQWEFIGQSNFRIFYNAARERLRPQDFSGLTQNRDFSLPGYGFTFSSSYFSRVSVSGFAGTGKGINFAPPAGRESFLANTRDATFTLTLRPLTPLRIDNSYLFSRLRDRDTGASIFNNNILRSRWNWQFSRELSVRFILQYDATLANPDLTALETTKNINADILITYLVNPWTALFVGYNGNAQNLDVVPTATGAQIVRPRRRFINDAKQFFVKFSYLLRF